MYRSRIKLCEKFVPKSTRGLGTVESLESEYRCGGMHARQWPRERVRRLEPGKDD